MNESLADLCADVLGRLLGELSLFQLALLSLDLGLLLCAATQLCLAVRQRHAF